MRNDTNVVVVDLRQHDGDILEGLWSTLEKQLQTNHFDTVLSQFATVTRDVLETGISSAVLDLAGNPAVRVPPAVKTEVQELARLMNAMYAELREITLVIDEADMAFIVDATTTQAAIHQMKAALALFTTFTKQRLQGNVILVSSEHAFPFGLRRERIAFNLDNLTGFLYAGEVPPKDMLLLLKEEWGVGQHLALALLAHYGGHVWETYQALRMLRGSQAQNVGLDPLKSTRVQDCLAWQQVQAEGELDPMGDVLKLLAVKGLAPIPSCDYEVAKVISQNHVGGVVKRGSFVSGLPLEAWGEAELGEVAATHSMRLAIAKQLVSPKLSSPFVSQQLSESASSCPPRGP